MMSQLERYSQGLNRLCMSPADIPEVLAVSFGARNDELAPLIAASSCRSVLCLASRDAAL